MFLYVHLNMCLKFCLKFHFLPNKEGSPGSQARTGEAEKPSDSSILPPSKGSFQRLLPKAPSPKPAAGFSFQTHARQKCLTSRSPLANVPTLLQRRNRRINRLWDANNECKPRERREWKRKSKIRSRNFMPQDGQRLETGVFFSDHHIPIRASLWGTLALHPDFNGRQHVYNKWWLFDIQFQLSF